MPHNLEYSQHLTRRTFLLGTGKALLMCGLLGRMYQLQILEGRRYKTLADGNRIAFRLTPGPRGRLLDRLGHPLALNKNTFQAVLLAEKAPDLEEAIHRLSHFINLFELDLEALLENLHQKSSSFVPLLIKDNLSWEEVCLLEVHRCELPGIAVEVGQRRFYPFGAEMAHFLGYVGLPTKEEQKAENTPPVPGLYVGKSGVEKILNRELRGLEGIKSLEIDAHRHVVRELEGEAAQPGRDVRLSLDHRLQTYGAKCLCQHESGSVVVLDTWTGGILSLISHPAFDPNLFVSGIPQKAWRDILSRPQSPLVNKAVAGLFPPGSTIKMIMALAGLASGAITPSTKISCTGFITLHNHRFHCHTKNQGHGALNIQEALMCSCDIFFYEMSRRIGIEKMQPFFHEFGLGKRLMPDFPGEKTGLVPSPAWKKEKTHKKWSVSDTIMTGIGQGYLLATPLQLATMTARLATGRRVLPSYLAPKTDLVNFPGLSIKEEDLQLVRESMNRVVNDPRGTAFRSRIPYEGAEMAGKTGTSQVRRISLQEREAGKTKAHHYSWKERDHAFFSGYAPVQNPRYSIVVLVEHGGSGSAVAAPIARDILWMAQKLERENQKREFALIKDALIKD